MKLQTVVTEDEVADTPTTHDPRATLDKLSNTSGNVFPFDETRSLGIS